VFNGVKKIKNVKYVGAPPPGVLDKSNFDTLWSVTFTQSPGTVDSIETEDEFATTDTSLEDASTGEESDVSVEPTVEEPVG